MTTSATESELRIEEPTDERLLVVKVGEEPYDEETFDAGPPCDAALPWFGPVPAGNEPPHHMR